MSAIWARVRRSLESEHGRLLPMEGVRGVAVILVFLHHYATQAIILFKPAGATGEVAARLKDYGNLGVELFFVLSGMLIYGLLIRKSTNIGTFLSRRAVRIYPAFLVAFAIALTANLPSIIALGPITGTQTIVANLLLLPGLFPFDPILTVAWSLSYEVFFYVATALLVCGLGMRNWPQSARILFICCLTAGFCAASLAGVPGVPVRMLPFFGGMLLAELFASRAVRIPSLVGLLAPLAAMVIGVHLTHMPLVHEFAHAVAFFALCAACFTTGSLAARLLSWSPLRWLGNMSYSYYLMHGFAVTAGARIIARFYDFEGLQSPFWGLLPFFFAASLVPSYLLYLTVEKPFSLAARKPALLAANITPA